MDPTMLLEKLKERLKVDWNEDDNELIAILKQSEFYFQTKIGALDSEDEMLVELILERSRYAWNNALDEFEANFSKELGAFLQRYALKEWRKNEKNT